MKKVRNKLLKCFLTKAHEQQVKYQEVASRLDATSLCMLFYSSMLREKQFYSLRSLVATISSI